MSRNGLCSTAVALLSLSAVAAGQSVTPAATPLKLALSPQGPPPQPIDVEFVNAYSLMGPVRLAAMTAYTISSFPASGFMADVLPYSDQNVNSSAFVRHSITYISCDPSDYKGYTNATTLLNDSFNDNATAVIFYSNGDATCAFTNDTASTLQQFVFSMTSAADSFSVHSGLQSSSAGYAANIQLRSNDFRFTNDSAANGSPGAGPGPSTAVAMVILYSITGVITGLFLIIIVTGAIRAHRHPERYGPRHVLGRARQSRARGIARAMLDTIPIVKFGEREDEKPADVELHAGAVNEAHSSAESAQQPGSEHGPVEAVKNDGETSARSVDATDGAAATPSAVGSTSAHHAPDSEGLGCSICTDDFERGQDIRVLPCNHKFHPACVDPWLLNVSGTCPLCRIDLRPKSSDPGEGEDPLAPPLVNAEESSGDAHRRSTILAMLSVHQMQHSTPEERIAALRRYRQDHRSGSGDQSRRSRLASRLHDAFGIRTRRANNAQPGSTNNATASEER